ncbi:MAG: hypothetical protein A2341_09955 [Deltaproteobacteria bacterium RIFOXYB12_FULL_58_9]|nr:MAG: hypothetical protein A2341_09955 [Deltaproteobacteria bacterium RIFOXYB12_FULL_58_9]
MIAVLLLLSASSLTICKQVTLRAEVDASGREVRGEVTCVVGRDGEVAVAIYPEVLGPERGLDDVNREWFYPEGFSPARLSVWLDGRRLKTRGPWLTVGTYAKNKIVRLTFATDVPRRNGTFGQSEMATYLLGGWYPMFGDGRALAALPTTFSVTVPTGLVGSIGGLPVTRDGPRTVAGKIVARFVPVVLARELVVRSGPAATILAPTDTRDSPRRLGSGRDAAALTELEATVVIGADFAMRHGFGVDVRPLVVLAPLRENLVEAFDGGFAVSDRAFRLSLAERFLKLHRASLWRQQLALLVLPHCRRRETHLSPTLVADLVASALREQLMLQAYGGVEYAPDMLEDFAITREIDSLILAPQMTFRDTYFAVIDETPRVRWRLDDFDHTLPRGKLLYEKLVDLLGRTAVAKIVDRYLLDDAPFATVAGIQAGRPLEEWLVTWLSSYPQVNYSVRQVDAEESIVVIVEASGPDAARVVEPVTVEVVDAAGVTHRQKRLGPGELRFAALGPAAQVVLDPEHRLVEQWQTAGQGSRFDNQQPPSWRFMLSGLAGAVSATNTELDVVASFSLRRLHDLRWRWDYVAAYGPTKLGFATGATWGFGAEVTPLVLAHQVGLSVGYERLRREGANILPGDQLSLLAHYRFDDRLTPYWSFTGKGWTAHAAWTIGRGVKGDPYTFANFGGAVLGILPLAFGHSLVGRLRGDLNLGDTPPQELLSVGDLYHAGRGYLRDDARGSRRFVATGEYRHLLAGDANTDFGGVVTWTRWEGALFADGVALDVDDPRGCARTWFADVGYGLRFIGDALGVLPVVVTVDFGVPLVHCSGARTRPLTVYLGFFQSLAWF